MLLDSFVQVYDFNEVHAIAVQANQDKTFRAIKQVTPAEIPLFRTMISLRSLPRWVVGRRPSAFEPAKALFEQVLTANFVLLAEETNRELVLGTIGKFWRLQGSMWRKINNAQDFIAFDRPDYVKVCLNFLVDRGSRDDHCSVTTETRIRASDPIARKKFAAYWQLIKRASALSRREWLKAIKQRAERNPTKR